MQKSLLFLVLFLLSVGSVRSQILISLIFGDKLNSEKLEFGLDGGLSLTDINNLEGTEMRKSLNLGLYFDIRLRERSDFFLHTGVIIKSSAGAKGLDPYLLGDTDLDVILSESEVQRRLHYFYIPALFRYRHPSFFFVEAGPQIGLLAKAQDRFVDNKSGGNSVMYTNNIIDDYNRIDAGTTLGLGYELLKGEGITIGARYYFGLTNILKNSNTTQQNRVAYFFVSIPIGAHKKEE